MPKWSTPLPPDFWTPYCDFEFFIMVYIVFRTAFWFCIYLPPFAIIPKFDRFFMTASLNNLRAYMHNQYICILIVVERNHDLQTIILNPRGRFIRHSTYQFSFLLFLWNVSNIPKSSVNNEKKMNSLFNQPMTKHKISQLMKINHLVWSSMHWIIFFQKMIINTLIVIVEVDVGTLYGTNLGLELTIYI